jgi:hypothetical protein
MFENFSKTYEGVFRVIFIIWVSLWGFINLINLIVKYASFSSIYDNGGSQLGLWWVDTIGHVLTITFGISLFSFMLTIPGKIKKNKPVTNVSLMVALVIFYYLFITVMNIVANLLFDPGGFAKYFAFSTAWLLPSIVLMVFHILYFVNVNRYNVELEEKQPTNNSN